MKYTSISSAVATIAATSLFLATTAFPALAAEGDKVVPSATVDIKETQFGFILNGDVGHGTLHFNGENKLFHMHGAKLGGVGITGMDIVGEVYYLERIEDFDGLYFKADLGMTIINADKVGMWLKNDDGTVLHLRSTDAKGLALSIGIEGVNISL